MLDVSEAIDPLFSGVVPERIAGLETLWGNGSERAFLSNRPRLLPAQSATLGSVFLRAVPRRCAWSPAALCSAPPSAATSTRRTA